MNAELFEILKGENFDEEDLHAINDAIVDAGYRITKNYSDAEIAKELSNDGLRIALAEVGFAIVPKEPTEAMIEAARRTLHAHIGYPSTMRMKFVKAIPDVIKSAVARAQEPGDD